MKNKVGKEEGLKEFVDDKDIKSTRECRGKLIKKRGCSGYPLPPRLDPKGGVRKRGPKKIHAWRICWGNRRVNGAVQPSLNDASEREKKIGKTMNHPNVDGGR